MIFPITAAWIGCSLAAVTLIAGTVFASLIDTSNRKTSAATVPERRVSA